MFRPLVFLALIVPTYAAAQECVAVVATSDLHGAIEPYRASSDAPRVGGVQGLSGYLNSLRELHGARLLLIDGGDLFQGTLASNLSKGRAVIDAYNLLGYDAVAIGNHEFDFGAETPGSADLLGALKARIGEARFPFLGINVYERGTHRRAAWAKPSVLLDKGGVKIGVIGAATPETTRVTRPQNVTTLEFRDPVALVVAEARRLRAEGARLIVLTMHIGGRCGRTRDPRDLSSCDTESDLFTLLARLPQESIDVAVGGHTHQDVAHWVHGVATVQPGARAQKIAWVDACLKDGGGLDTERSRIHPLIDVCLDEWRDGGCNRRKDKDKGKVALVEATFRRQPLAPDPALAEAMAPYLNAVREAYQRPIGVHLREPLLRDGSPSLGELVGEALVKATGADVGVQNLGGVRADLPAGALIFGQAFEVLPFDNRVAVLTLTGAQLKAFVDLLAGRRSGVGPYLAGATTLAADGKLDLRVRGAPVASDQLYRVATSDFLAQGGEGLDAIFGALPDAHLKILNASMLEVLIDHLRERYPDGAR